MEKLEVNGKEIPEELRTKCEVWSRPCGYLRPTNLYNAGKKQEYGERKNFQTPQNKVILGSTTPQNKKI